MAYTFDPATEIAVETALKASMAAFQDAAVASAIAAQSAISGGMSAADALAKHLSVVAVTKQVATLDAEVAASSDPTATLTAQADKRAALASSLAAVAW